MALKVWQQRTDSWEKRDVGKKERKKREEAKEKEKERERMEKAARGVGKGYRTVLCGRLHQRERPWERRGVGVDLACVTQTRRPGHLISLFLSSALPILAALEPPIVFKSIHFPISTVAATFFCSLLRSRNFVQSAAELSVRRLFGNRCKWSELCLSDDIWQKTLAYFFFDLRWCVPCFRQKSMFVMVLIHTWYLP